MRTTRAAPIRKTRHRFVHEGAYFELDEFKDQVDPWLLEVELADDVEAVKAPDALGR